MSRRILSSIFALAAAVFVVSVVGLAFAGRQQDPASKADLQAEQTDLSGTYKGVFDCEAAGVSGETTLTITGNQFTLADGKSGRIVAATTRGYTGVAMQFGEFTMPGAGQPAVPPATVVSLRARKSGARLTLTAVPGGTKCSFTPAGSAARGKRRSRPAAGETNRNMSPAATPSPTP